jgi:hypothetical protein
MEKQTNFEDSLFLINCRTRLLQDTLKLDADIELFTNMSGNDIDFLSQALSSVQAKLAENTRLIDREALMHNLLESISSFITALEKIPARFPGLEERCSAILSDMIKERDQVEDELATMDGNMIDEHEVSQAEMAELLQEINPL